MKRCLCLLLFFFSLHSINTQTPLIDSLLNCLNKPVKMDTMRVFQYNELAWNYIDVNIESSKIFLIKSVSLSKKINFYNGNLDALNTQGIVYRIENQHEKAVLFTEQIVDVTVIGFKI